MKPALRAYLFIVGGLILGLPQLGRADKVILKNGKVYTGKILMDSDEAVLIGTPYDTQTYLLPAKDIDTIVYEQYHAPPPAVRRRGLLLDIGTSGNFFPSPDLALHPAAGLWAGAGLRVHPLFEMDGGFNWIPNLSASSGGLLIENAATKRNYQSFWSYSGEVAGRFYPFALKKKWPTEPYLTVGYHWDHLIPKASGDSLSGGGWLFGLGAIRPLTRHLFLEGRVAYEPFSFKTVQFLGAGGNLSPPIDQKQVVLSIGISYRL